MKILIPIITIHLIYSIPKITYFHFQYYRINQTLNFISKIILAVLIIHLIAT